MAALKEILAKFGFEVDSRNLKKAEKDTDSFAKKVVSAFAAAEIVGGIKNFVLGMMDVEGRISDTSAALGISRSAFQEWTYVASRGGASAEDMSTALKILQKNAADGSKAFKDLGVDVKDSTGKTKETSALMGEVATALAAVEDPAQRTKLALEVLGKGGSKLNAIFAQGPEAIAELRKRFVELGGGLSEEALDAIGGAADALDDVELASTSLKGNLMMVLAPGLRWITNLFASLIAYFNKGDSAATRMKSALVTLGVVGAAAGWSMLKPYLPFLAAVAAIYLIVQDFYTFLQGGDSATGRLLEWLFGKGAAEDVRQSIKDFTEDVKKFKKELDQKPGGGTIFDWLEEGFSRAGEQLVRFVVDDVPEAMRFATDGRITNIWSTIGTSAIWGLINAMTGGLPDLAVQMWQGAMRTVDQVKDGLSSMSEVASEAIGDLIDGLVSGLDGALERVKTATVNLITGGIKQPMRDTLQERSPSKLTFQSGINAGRGLAGGLIAIADEVAAASSHVAAMAAAPITHQGGSISRNVNVNVRNQNSIAVQAANNPMAVGRAVGGTMSAWGFDDRNRLLQVLDTA